MNVTVVPVSSTDSSVFFKGATDSPSWKVISYTLPSRFIVSLRLEDSALTTDTPTPDHPRPYTNFDRTFHLRAVAS